MRRELHEVSEWAVTIGDDPGDLREGLARIEASRGWRLTEPFRRAAKIWQSRSAILARPTAMRLRRALRALPLPTGPMTGLKRFVLHRVFGIAPRSNARSAVASAGRRRAGDPDRVTALPPLAPARLPDVFMWGIADSAFRRSAAATSRT